MKTLINQQYFIPTDVLRVHKGIAMEFKFKARNQNANDIDSATNSMRNTLYKLIHNNRNNTTQKVYIGITEHFSKPEEILIAKDLVDLLTGIKEAPFQFLLMKGFMMINITIVMFLLYTLDQVLENYWMI